jgi:cytochrome P450
VDAPVTFDPFAAAFAADPYPHYAELRRLDPVHRHPIGFWVLTRHQDVTRFLRDPTLSVEDRNARPGPVDALVRALLGDRADRGSRAMLNRDPPDHTRLRRLVSKAFTPRAIERLRPRVQAAVDAALDRAAAAGELDVVGELAFPVPFTVICEMLGMPAADRDRVREWSHLIVRSLEPLVDPALILRIAEAGDQMRAFIGDVIAHKRRAPADDMLTALIQAEEQGDVLSDEELLEQVILLFIAGHETTVNLIGNGTLALLRHPDQLARLRHDPSLLPNAVEELLRYDSPVQMSRRITLADVEVGGRTIEAGSFVALVLASANRDPALWGDDADRLDLARPNAAEHVSFGGGHHYCLGAALARLEAQVALGTLVRRFPGLRLAGEPVWNGRINLRGLERLPVAV